jgi:hypothetical protein
MIRHRRSVMWGLAIAAVAVIQGRYETQTAESGGYYERVWVEGYWTE